MLDLLAVRSSARTLISRARGTRPRMSGMLRQPSQSSTISGPAGVISGIDDRHRLVIGCQRLVVLRRDGGDEEAKALVHLRRRQPDAVVLVHRLDHVVDQLLHDACFSSARSISRARARSTGWPMRATFNSDMSNDYPQT